MSIFKLLFIILLALIVYLANEHIKDELRFRKCLALEQEYRKSVDDIKFFYSTECGKYLDKILLSK